MAVLVVGAALAYVLLRSDDPQAAPGAPNVVVIMTDDQVFSSFTRKAMPNLFELLGDGGTSFTDAYAIPPLCCPARAGFLTGQYPHNHGVRQNDYGQLRDPESTLASWLDESGYEVALTGKFMNVYRPTEPAPGFDHWWEIRSLESPGYWEYPVNDNGELSRAGRAPEDYSTLAVTREALEFIDRAAGEPEPFFLWVSYWAPHHYNDDEAEVCDGRTVQALPRDWRRFRDDAVELPPEFNEADVSDKPAPPRGEPRLDAAGVAEAIRDVRCSRAAIHRVDAGIGELVAALRSTGVADETAILFLSDNGVLLGEHRLTDEKTIPYQAALHVPMGARVPAGVLGGTPVAKVSEPVGTIDLAPTILELAGAEPCAESGCRVMDGRSLVGLMRGERQRWPRARARLTEAGGNCGRYAAVDRGRWLYAQRFGGKPPDCRTTATELYDLEADPRQLDNLLGIPETRSRPGVEAKAQEMASLLAELRECSGIRGRDDTDRPC